MRNKIIILLIFLIPMAVFAFLQYNSNANATPDNIELAAYNKGKLLKFHSPMCSECKTVGQNIKSAMKDYETVVMYEEVDVTNKDNKTKNLIDTYKVTVVPTVVFIDKNGKISAKTEGAVDQTEIKLHLEEIK